MSGPEEQAAADRLKRLQCARRDMEEARYSGARRVRDQNGEEIEFRSDRELATAIAAIDREIAMARAAPSTIRFRTSKGLDHA